MENTRQDAASEALKGCPFAAVCRLPAGVQRLQWVGSLGIDIIMYPTCRW